MNIGMDDAVARVRRALLAHDHADTITAFPEGTRTAAEAAAAVGCSVAQIAKSIVFRAGASGGEQAVVVITSGANRVDKRLAGEAVGLKLAPAGPEFVLAATGFAAGGVSPVGLLGSPLLVMDEDLLALGRVWAAAGSAQHVFETTAPALLAMTGAAVARIRQA